ncbi:uncharacterized protein BDV17DRAFT_195138 [Aspergillus undulatus]|uniref:uncharacterized protein n=1 Tax=Aspergillus undulatus TaxID=1810928 RepID=UPI003CCC9FD5
MPYPWSHSYWPFIAETHAYTYPHRHPSSYPPYRHRPQPQPEQPKPKPTPKCKSSAKPEYVKVWHKDPLPGNPRHWRSFQRLTDVLTGKGPDIHVEKRSPRSSSPPARERSPKPAPTDMYAHAHAYSYGRGDDRAYAPAHAYARNHKHDNQAYDSDVEVVNGGLRGRRPSRGGDERPDIFVEERRPRIRRTPVHVHNHGNNDDAYDSDTEAVINGKPCGRRESRGWGKRADIVVEERRPRIRRTPVHVHNHGNNDDAYDSDTEAVINGKPCGRRESRGWGKRADIVVEERTPRTRRAYVHNYRNDNHGYDCDSDMEVLINGKTRGRGASRRRNGDGAKGSPNQTQQTGRDWTLWNREHLKDCRKRKCDECERLRAQEKRDNVFCWVRRDPDERYDFRTRKYAVPDKETWRKVEYCDNWEHVNPTRYWDRYGSEWVPAGLQHDKFYEPHEKQKPVRRRVLYYY